MSAPLFLLKRLGVIKQSISHHNSLGEKWGWHTNSNARKCGAKTAQRWMSTMEIELNNLPPGDLRHTVRMGLIALSIRS